MTIRCGAYCGAYCGLAVGVVFGISGLALAGPVTFVEQTGAVGLTHSHIVDAFAYNCWGWA